MSSRSTFWLHMSSPTCLGIMLVGAFVRHESSPGQCRVRHRAMDASGILVRMQSLVPPGAMTLQIGPRSSLEWSAQIAGSDTGGITPVRRQGRGGQRRWRSSGRLRVGGEGPVAHEEQRGHEYKQ